MNDIHALTGAYAVDALDDAERAAFEAHLAECESCRTEVAELTETASLLGALTDEAPPAGQRDAVLSAIGTVRPLPPLPSEPPVLPAAQETPRSETVAPVVPLRRRPGRRFATWAAAAAVVAAVGTGIAVTQPWAEESIAPSASSQVLQADDAQRVSLSFPDGAQATLVRSVSEGRAVLVTKDMPAPPQGKVYQLWLETPAGSMQDAGLMPVRADQTVLLDGDASAATGAGITVEPAGGSPAPTSEPIALFDLAGSA
ncbi:anti-sigma factor domain-containing protein [Nocardioides sp. Bht2]|uniref:anti-sigma factor n=1 Tax=Nocardioides sp. Bht2 TaxID=3392297 RepID=UPI0039B3D44C